MATIADTTYNVLRKIFGNIAYKHKINTKIKTQLKRKGRNINTLSKTKQMKKMNITANINKLMYGFF